MVRCMKYSTLILIVICSTAMSVLALRANGQDVLKRKITVSFKDVSLNKALDVITKTSGVTFTYNASQIKNDLKLTGSFKNVELETVLNKLFSNLPYSFSVVADEIIIKYDPQKLRPDAEKKTENQQANPIRISGTVTDNMHNPLAGVTIHIAGRRTVITTDESGSFQITVPDKESVLIFSYIGYATKEVPVGNQLTMEIHLMPSNSDLDEVQVIAYGSVQQI